MSPGDVLRHAGLPSALFTGVLRGKVAVIALDARRVDLMGVRSQLGEQLVEDLGRERLEAFAALATSVEIPVKLDREVVLPQVGPRGGVRIDRAAIPLSAAVADVKSLRGRLWICIRADVQGADGRPGAS